MSPEEWRKLERFLESPAAAFAAPFVTLASGDTTTRPVGDSVGMQIGPYRVIDELGGGGMGVVFLAERIDGSSGHRVALKVIKRGLDSGDIYRRFVSEREILARLRHPNIARLLDAGVTAEGRPYFAMEYVAGTAITAHCDDRRLGIDDRLRLFAAVCEAVRHAHVHNVVHRDLKPTNILVTAEGDVKLLDFGIAKLLREDPSDPASRDPTRVGAWLLTPEYAAPEQLGSGAPTASTDVYALGAVLYELLTGRRAQRIVKRSVFEVARVLRMVTPERPSDVVLQQDIGDQYSPHEMSAFRGTDPAGLQRRLLGDLDRIVLTALQKEPALRYRSAGELLAELSAFCRP